MVSSNSYAFNTLVRPLRRESVEYRNFYEEHLPLREQVKRHERAFYKAWMARKFNFFLASRRQTNPGKWFRSFEDIKEMCVLFNNALFSNKRNCKVEHSEKRLKFVSLLYKQGYIISYRVFLGNIEVKFKYVQTEPLVRRFGVPKDFSLLGTRLSKKTGKGYRKVGSRYPRVYVLKKGYAHNFKGRHIIACVGNEFIPFKSLPGVEPKFDFLFECVV